MSDPNAEWLPLPSPRMRDLLLSSERRVIFIVTLGVAELALVASESFHSGSWMLFWIVVLAEVVLLAAALLVVYLVAGRAVRVGLDGGRLRVGKRSIVASSVTRLVIDRRQLLGGREAIAMRAGSTWLGVPSVVLAINGSSALDDRQRDALVRFVERTRATLPRDRWDPRGNMSRRANPGILLPEDAVEIIEDPVQAARFLPPSGTAPSDGSGSR